MKGGVAMYYVKQIKDPKLRQEIVDEYADGNGLATSVIAKKHNVNEQSVVFVLEDFGKM